MTLTESLVSSFLLMLLASQSGRVFMQSMQTVGDTQIRDQVALSISRDLEQVRNTVNLWQVDENNLDDNDLPLSGEMTYEPDEDMCKHNTLALGLLSAMSANDHGELNEEETRIHRQKTIAVDATGLNLTRTISSDSSNKNLLKVHYTVNANVLNQSDQSTTLVMPAQAWCP